MAGLQRSAQTFRRSGSSGLVWDERFLTEGADADGGGGSSGHRRRPELRHSRSVGSVGGGLLRRGEAGAEDGDKKRTKAAAARPKQRDQQRKKQQEEEEEEQEVVRGTGRKAFRSRDVAPSAEPPSPRLPVGCCAPCAIFRGSGGASLLARRAKPRKR